MYKYICHSPTLSGKIIIYYTKTLCSACQLVMKLVLTLQTLSVRLIEQDFMGDGDVTTKRKGRELRKNWEPAVFDCTVSPQLCLAHWILLLYEWYYTNKLVFSLLDLSHPPSDPPGLLWSHVSCYASLLLALKKTSGWVFSRSKICSFKPFILLIKGNIISDGSSDKLLNYIL